MKDAPSPKTLQMLVHKEWLVESLKGLGGGYLTHLTYHRGEIAPDVLEDLRNQKMDPDVFGEIIHRDHNVKRLVAVVEIVQVHDFLDFYRFELRILEVSPFIRSGDRGIIIPDSEYLCFYRP